MKRIWVDRSRCLGCKTCEIQCAVERNSLSRCLAQAMDERPLPSPRVNVHGKSNVPFPLQCRHCEDASCLTACPSGAMQRHAQGNVFVDENRCRGCWMCVMACPFGVIRPAADYHVAIKCDGCLHMEGPACVAGCPTGALMHCDEQTFHKTLAERRNRVALWVAEHAPRGPISLDQIIPEETRP